MNTLEVELPESVPEDEARFMLALKLYESGRLTLGQAAEMSGYSKPTFMELAGKNGVPVFNYPPEDLEREMNM